MNYSKAIFLLSDDARAILVDYEPRPDGSLRDRCHWEMFKSIDPTIKAGDLVIVETSTRYGMTVCKVAEVDVEPDVNGSGHMGWIVGRVDTDRYDKILADETVLIDQIKAGHRRQEREKLRETMLAGLSSDEVKSLPKLSAQNVSEKAD